MPGTRADTHLDLKALRMAVHGWWLGNPLVYKPGAPNLVAIARELADAGATSGTLILGDTPSRAPTSALASSLDRIAAVLILREPLPRTPLELAAALAVAKVARTVLGSDYVRVLASDVGCEVGIEGVIGTSVPLCRVAVERDTDTAYLCLDLALGPLHVADGGNPSAALFSARADWREVFLARVLHTLDASLKEAS